MKKIRIGSVVIHKRTRRMGVVWEVRNSSRASVIWAYQVHGMDFTKLAQFSPDALRRNAIRFDAQRSHCAISNLEVE